MQTYCQNTISRILDVQDAAIINHKIWWIMLLIFCLTFDDTAFPKELTMFFLIKKKMSNIVNKDDDYTQLNLSKSVLSIFTQSISNILLCNTVINRKNTHKLYSREILVSRGTFRVVSDVWITFSMSQWPFVYKYILIQNR